MNQLKFGVCAICDEAEAHVLHHNGRGILPSGRQGHTFVAKHEDRQGGDSDLADWPLCAVCGKTVREGRHATDFGEGHDYVPLTAAEARPALYANRYAFRLEPYYSRHVNAMTAEALHWKGAIAAELAFRDQQIARLLVVLSSARGEITRLGTDGGGFSCTVIDDIDAALGGVKGAGL